MTTPFDRLSCRREGAFGQVRTGIIMEVGRGRGSVWVKGAGGRK